MGITVMFLILFVTFICCVLFRVLLFCDIGSIHWLHSFIVIVVHSFDALLILLHFPYCWVFVMQHYTLCIIDCLVLWLLKWWFLWQYWWQVQLLLTLIYCVIVIDILIPYYLLVLPLILCVNAGNSLYLMWHYPYILYYLILWYIDYVVSDGIVMMPFYSILIRCIVHWWWVVLLLWWWCGSLLLLLLMFIQCVVHWCDILDVFLVMEVFDDLDDYYDDLFCCCSYIFILMCPLLLSDYHWCYSVVVIVVHCCCTLMLTLPWLLVMW